MIITTYQCDGCGAREDNPFLTRHSHGEPGHWELFRFTHSAPPPNLHACSKDCALVIDERAATLPGK